MEDEVSNVTNKLNFLGTSKRSYTSYSRPMSTRENRVSARLEKLAAGSKESDLPPMLRNTTDYIEVDKNRESGLANSHTSISPSDKISEEPSDY